MLKKNFFNKTALAATMAALPVVSGAAVLEEIVVTAQKREQSLQDVPISIEVLGQEKLSINAVHDTADLSLASPSLVHQAGNGPVANNFSIRGIGSLAFEGGIQPSVSFVMDGIPLSRVGEFVADLGDIERIEILRGPQGTLYGRNATGGAINIVRALPAEEFGGYLEQTITDDDEYITRASVTGPFSDTVRGRLSAYYKDREPHVENIFPGVDDLGGEETYAMMGKLDIDISDSVNLLLTGDYRKLNSGEGFQVVHQVEDGALASLGTARLSALGNGDVNYGKQIINDPFLQNTSHPSDVEVENYGIGIDFTIELSENLTLKSLTGHRDFESASRLDADVSPSRGTNVLIPLTSLISDNLSTTGDPERPISQVLDYVSQEFRLEGTGEGYEWLAGVYYNDHDEETRASVPVLVLNPAFPGGRGIVTDPRTGGASWTSYAIFGDTTVWLTETVNVFAGLRWTVEDLDVHLDRDQYRIFPTISPAGSVNITDNFSTYNLSLARWAPGSSAHFTRSDRSEDWSGRIGLGWDVNEDTNVYVSASKGYVGAGANYSRTATLSDSVLEPSVTEAYEFGFKSRLLDGSMALSGAVFYQTVDDLQTSALIPGEILTTTFNAGNLEIKGLELNTTWAATDLLTLEAGLTWLDTEIDDLIQACYSGQTVAQGCNYDNNGDGTIDSQDVSGKSMVLAPDLSYSLSARLDIPLNSMPFNAYAMVVYTWQDEIQHLLTYDPLTMQADYGLFNAFVGIEDKEGRYSVSVFGKNLSDEYFDSSLSTSVGNQGKLLGRPSRNAQSYFGVKAKYNF